jgi:3-oxoacyl-[acyl-carrier protein] reductase
VDFSGKVALVTGGGRGIGRGISEVLASRGATVVVNYRQGRVEAEDTVRRIGAAGGQAVSCQADVTQASDVQRMVDWAMMQFGRIDVLVNNAGLGPPRTPFLYIPEQSWDEILAVNVKGVFLCSQAAAKEMVKRRYGKIINIASAAGFVAVAGIAQYCASKSAVVMLTKAMALELGPHNINVNAVAPGVVRTRQATFLDQPGVVERELAAMPLGRFGTPNDVAAAAVFLASDEASWISGVTVPLEGGMLTRSAQPISFEE